MEVNGELGDLARETEWTPRRRTKILALTALCTALVTTPAAYLGYETTIGGVWSHNTALQACSMTPTAGSISNRPGVDTAVRDRWTWWPPGHAHTCVYRMPNGKTILRPVRILDG